MTDRTRCLAIALITLNSLDILLCAGSIAYQIIGQRAGSLISSKNTLYNQGLVELASCASVGYPETKYAYLYLQLSVANVGMLLALLAGIVGLFFSVGLFGTTATPKWKYCSMPMIRIKATLYCMYATATLLAGTFTGFLLAPYFYIGSFTCSSPSAVTYQAELIIEIALGGASFLIALFCLILTFFIRVHKESKYADKGDVEMVPTGNNNNMRTTDTHPNEGNGMMTQQNYMQPENMLEFDMTKNPIADNGLRDNGTFDLQEAEMAELQESMLNKNQPEAEPEPGPLQIIPDPFMSNYQGRINTLNAPDTNAVRTRRYRLQTGAANRLASAAHQEDAPKQAKPNPFMTFTPEKPIRPTNQPTSSNRQPQQQPNHTRPGRQAQYSAGSQNQAIFPNSTPQRKLKSHPKLESSMKNSKYVDEAKYAAPEVPSFTAVALMEDKPMRPPASNATRPNERIEPADATMTLMNELNNMNFAEGNQANNTYGVIPEDADGSQLNHDQSLDIGVSHVLPDDHTTSRRLRMTPL